MDKTETIKKRYNRIANMFDLMESLMGEKRFEEWRKLTWSKAKGNILEVGVGTGRNMPFYPETERVTAIDFSENMIEIAKERLKKLKLNNVDLKLMDVQKLDFPDETFDTIITTCVFCSVPDPVKGLTEVRRVCKKDGQIIMLEHVKSKNPFIGFMMELMNPLIVRIVGANINRDTIGNLRKAELEIETDKNLMMDIVKHIKCCKK